ncbi:DUF6063 family protein [Texcoconibacillus texcoconensis]|uniref:Non-ribosomal peptide synthetase module n=1 Tax=Texcoconibacillus texcoconensis TaxID=1095777 RepID=A0A840QLW5_9BACI|nr:DUF6063 family protein [Texcoconibacillus texcoconensis]MBB5172364.1 hypothetical protein [Texcoconibacillus texcoconensis]
MRYDQEQVTQAFAIFSRLAAHGETHEDDLRTYFGDDAVRGVLDLFAQQVECVIITAGEKMYLVPKATTSMYHVKNDTLKKRYLKASAKNEDLYFMYFAVIVLFGMFYDSYQTMEPTLEYTSLSEWLDQLNERFDVIRGHDEETLARAEEDHEYNWRLLLEKWDQLDDLKETVKKQDRRTQSRLGFLNGVKQFLEDQGLVDDIGNHELTLTEKAKVIVQKYYMDLEHNRGILEFMYQWEEAEVNE